MTFYRPPVLAALLLSLIALPARADEVVRVMELAKPSIVRIEVLTERGAGGRMVKQRGFGSGAIISPEGHVLTNHHVAGRGTLANREVITTPSALYVPSQVLTGGVAVYNLDGELLGIATVYRNQSVIVPVAAIVSQAAGIPAPTERSGR